MKYRNILLIVFLILLADQVIKVYIKTHFYLGDSVNVLGEWFQLYFIENEGMAFGMKLREGALGKVILTLFRLVAVGFGFWWVYRLSKQGYGKGLLICAALILAGAAGNLIDSMFYGMIFNDSGYDPYNVAKLVPFGKGYSSFLHGRVVDMFYFPLIKNGKGDVLFFSPIFNLADAAISTGVLVLLFFQKRLLKKDQSSVQQTQASESSVPDHVTPRQ